MVLNLALPGGGIKRQICRKCDRKAQPFSFNLGILANPEPVLDWHVGFSESVF